MLRATKSTTPYIGSLDYSRICNVEKCTSTWAVQAVCLQTLYIAYFKLEEMNSHGKCVASPRLTTPSQHSITGSGQLHGKLSVLTR